MIAPLKLADQCEQATGPDRYTDVEIAVAVDWRWPDWEEGESTARGQAEKHGIDWLFGRTEHGMASMWRHIPRYTASLDAAMTLVPEGHSWLLSVGGMAIAQVTDCTGDACTEPPDHDGHAAIPALALCAAALRARAASCDTQPKAGDVKQAPLVSGAVGEAETHKPSPDHPSEIPVE